MLRKMVEGELVH